MDAKPEVKPEVRTITVAHSPDSDDAFMFYGLATNKLETEGLKFVHTLKDIQSLNEDAKNGVFRRVKADLGIGRMARKGPLSRPAQSTTLPLLRRCPRP